MESFLKSFKSWHSLYFQRHDLEECFLELFQTDGSTMDTQLSSIERAQDKVWELLSRQKVSPLVELAQ